MTAWFIEFHLPVVLYLLYFVYILVFKTYTESWKKKVLVEKCLIK